MLRKPNSIRIARRDFERKAYRSMLRRLRPGDIVILHSLDRLGRDYKAILDQWQYITKDKALT